MRACQRFGKRLQGTKRGLWGFGDLMSGHDLDRRRFLRRIAGASAAASGMLATRAFAQDAALDALIEQNLNGDFGQGFDPGSRTIQMPKASLPTLSPATAEYTEQALQAFEAIVSRGGWPEIQPMERAQIGVRHPGVPALRQRLMVSGDLDANTGVTDVYDSYVEAAVRRFQARHGLLVNGLVRGPTLKAMNVPATTRLAQLRINAVRLRSLSDHLGNRFVVCNIPAARIEAIENGVAVSRHTAVVGKPDRPSPDINSKIVEVNFNPYWTVPASIVRRDLIPKMRAEPDYLTVNRIRIFDPRGNELTPSQINWYSDEANQYMFKQDPGDLNSLGSIRINFPSKDGVYMHDTPLKNLFGEDMRFHSSGCVRVQNVRELVNWLLVETPGWSRAEIDEVIRSGERKDARLVRPVPLYWVYVTAWATPDGVTQFREDIYHRDNLGPIATTQRG
jgi:murein L,D-transpeptidase YcbB/YkuD